MKASGFRWNADGFSLIELLTAMTIFLVICAIAFGLLTTAMKRYQTDSQVLTTFQEARFGLDQIVRDIDDSGYPPQNQFQVLPTNPYEYAVTPVAWAPSYPGTPCQIGVNCSTPGDFDVILETKVNPASSDPHLQWIRYQLQGKVLYRAIMNKDSSNDPDGTTSTGFVPYVQNVINDSTADIPGGVPVPIFQYFCDTSSGPKLCTDPAVKNTPDNSPEKVRSVSITLIVKAPFPDAQTGQPRLVELRGRGRRINPSD